MKAAARPESTISFSTLAGVGVVPTSPSWPAVEKAMDYLRMVPPPPPGPEYANAVATVREFAALVRRNGPTIAMVLLCGTMLGELRSNRGTTAALRTGLKILSEAYRFNLQNEDITKETLIVVYRQLRGILGHNDWKPSFPEDVGASGGDWAAKLNADIQTVRSVRLPETYLATKLGVRAIERIEAFLDGRKQYFPHAEEVVAHAAGEVNSKFLRWDLDRMTALQWSGIIAAWMSPERPENRPAEWLVAAALVALGFDDAAVAEMAAWLYPGEPPTRTIDAPAYGRRWPVPAASLVFVRDVSKRTVAERWLPWPGVAALVLAPDAAATVLGRLIRAKKEPPFRPEIRYIAIEGPEAFATLLNALSSALGRGPLSMLHEQFQVALVMPDKETAALSGIMDLGGRLVIRPRDLKDLAAQMGLGGAGEIVQQTA